MKHIISEDTLRITGETTDQFFLRVAREKPNAEKYKGCEYCGQDHRGPAQYWPEGEWERHRHAGGEDIWGMDEGVTA